MMMVILYKVISFGKNYVCMEDVHIMCVCSLCDPTGTYKYI